MKIGLLVALAGFAISSALLTFAQEREAVDPEVRQQIAAVNTKLGEAQNSHDAAAAAALYTLDAVKVLDWSGGGTLLGREAIEKDFAVLFASNPPDVTSKFLQMYAMATR